MTMAFVIPTMDCFLFIILKIAHLMIYNRNIEAVFPYTDCVSHFKFNMVRSANRAKMQ